jgi:putative FmdB family regulatory protein
LNSGLFGGDYANLEQTRGQGMPIYEYRCDACGHTLDALQKISDPPLTDCPVCDSTSLRKLVSAPAFRLKGSGWYETDFKSDKDRKRNLADSGDSSGAVAEKKADDAGAGESSSKGSSDKSSDKSSDGKPKSSGKPSHSKPSTGDQGSNAVA